MPLAAGVIVLATLAAYANSFQGVMLGDDLTSIQENPTIRHLWPIWPVLNPPHNGETVSGRPLLNLSFAINYALGGTNVWGYHAVNLAIHILAALTLFGIVRRTFLLPSVLPLPSLSNGLPLPSLSKVPPLPSLSKVLPLPLRERAGVRGVACSPIAAHRASAATPLAFAIALLWALHPLQTESVTYIVQRAESLCGLFYLLTLYCVIRGSDSGTNPPSAFRLPPSAFFWYSAAVLACLLGMATKEVMVTAPLVVLLYDRTFLAGSFGQAFRRRWGLYLGLAATWGLLAWIVYATGLLPRRQEFGAPDPISYAMSQPGVILHYLRLSLWPHPLCLDYSWPVARSLATIVPAAISVGSMFALMVWGQTRRSSFSFLAAWLLLILLPTSSVIPLTDVQCEHRMYLPLAAVIAALATGAHTAFRAGGRARRLGTVPLKILAVSVVGIIGMLFCVLTSQRNAVYQSQLCAWRDVLSKAPQNARAYNNLGLILAERGRMTEAISHYRKALEIQQDYANAHQNLALALAHEGMTGESIAHYRRAVAIRPTAEGYNNLGNTLWTQGKPAEAIAQFRMSLTIDPRCAVAHYNLGNVLSREGRTAEAIAEYRQALEIDPRYAKVHNNLATVLWKQGNTAEAVAEYNKALEINPRYVESHVNVGLMLAEQRRLPEAIAHFQTALTVDPRFAAAHYYLGTLLCHQRNSREAVRHWREAIRLEPGAVAVLNVVAWTLATDPDASFRNAAEALDLAKRAAELSDNRDPAILDTLAAALAEAGRFTEAVETAQHALQLAVDQRNTSLPGKISARIKLYQSGSPFRDFQ